MYNFARALICRRLEASLVVSSINRVARWRVTISSNRERLAYINSPLVSIIAPSDLRPPLVVQRSKGVPRLHSVYVYSKGHIGTYPKTVFFVLEQ